MGYKFRRSSVNYDNLFRNWEGHADYDKRWQVSGDENSTIVPSMPSGFNAMRNLFYTYSEDLVRDGSHIRLQDITIGYDVQKLSGNLSFRSVSIYAFADNLGILWRKNKENIDPDYVPLPNSVYLPRPLKVSLGIKASF